MSAESDQKLLTELRVMELKQELEKRGLDKNGIKIILIDRLEKAIQQEGHDPKTYQFTISPSTIASPVTNAENQSSIKPVESKKEESVTEKTAPSDAESAKATEEEKETKEPVPEAKQIESAENVEPEARKDEPMDSTVAEKQYEDPLDEQQPPSATEKIENGSNGVDDKKEKDDVSTRSIWVRGLTLATKAADLKALFSEHGKVIRAKIFTTKGKAGNANAACFGYVTMSDVESMEKCVAAMHKKVYKGRTLTVEKGDKSRVPPAKPAAKKESSTATKSEPVEKAPEPEKATDESAAAKDASDIKEPDEPQKAEEKTKTEEKAKTESERSKEKPKDSERSRHSSSRDRSRHNTTSSRRQPVRDPKRDAARHISAARRPIPHRTPSYRSGLSSGSSRSIRPLIPSARGGSFDRHEVEEMLRRQQEAFRRREQEAELLRERERLRYERERIEREKLELELANRRQQLEGFRAPDSGASRRHTESSRPSRDSHSSHSSARDRSGRISAPDSRKFSNDRIGAARERERERTRSSDHRGTLSSSHDRSRSRPHSYSSRPGAGAPDRYPSSRGESGSSFNTYGSRESYSTGMGSSSRSSFPSSRGVSNSGASWNSTNPGYGNTSSSSWANSSAGMGSSAWSGSSRATEWGSSSGHGQSLGGAAGSSTMRYDYDKYQRRF